MQDILRKSNSSIILAVFTVVVFLTPLFSQLMRNNLMKLIEDISYFFMLVISVYLIRRNNNLSIKISNTVVIFLFTFSIFSIIGIYYSGFALVILQFREFEYLLLLVILLPYNAIEDYKYIWPVLKAIAAVCVPVSLVQWAMNPTNGDIVTGIMGFGASGILTMFLCIVFFTEFMLRLKSNIKITGIYFLYLVPTAFNETKITIFILPVMFITSLYFCGKLKFKYIIQIAVVVGLLGLGWTSVYENIAKINGAEDKYSKSPLNVNTLTDYLFASDWQEDSGRMTKVLLALDIIKNQPLFGFGLGAAYGGLTSGINGVIYEKHSGPREFSGTRNQLALSIVDFGVLGTIINLLVFLSVLAKIVKIKRLELEGILTINSLMIIIICIPYNDIFYAKRIMFLFVMFSLVAIRLKKSREFSDTRGESQLQLKY